jgi:hypothetical protein
VYEIGAAAPLEIAASQHYLLIPEAIHLLPIRFGPAASSPPPKLSVTIEARRTSSRAGLLSFSLELYADFCHLSTNARDQDFQGGIVEISASDRELFAVMRQYFGGQFR